jgi:hypothetical protein
MAFVVKSYRQDLSMQSRFRGLVWWWLKDQLRQFLTSLNGRHALPPRMILAELWGGIVGLAGEYPRSQKRVEGVKEQFSARN